MPHRAKSLVEVSVTGAPSPLVLLVAGEDAAAAAARVLATYFSVASATTLLGARALLSGIRFDIVVAEHELPDGTGSQLLAELQESAPSVGRILISAGAMPDPEGVAQLSFSSSCEPTQLVDGIRALVTRAERRTVSGEVPKGSTPLDDD